MVTLVFTMLLFGSSFFGAPNSLLLESSTQEDVGWQTIGQVTVFGQSDIDSRKLAPVTVPIRFPETNVVTFDPNAPHVVDGEWKIQLNEWGNLMRRYKGNGGWNEFRQLYEEAQKEIESGRSKTWRVKCVIFRRTDVLYERKDGVFEPQRGIISDQDLIFCLETFARFKALVEAFTRGAVKVELVVSVEEEPIAGSYKGDEVWSFHPFDAGDNYLRGRFNFGDFDSILYMHHPGQTRSYSFGGALGRTNHATQAYVILSNGREQGPRIGHTEAMLHEWFHQVEDTYSVWGYGGWEGAQLPNLHAAEQNGYSVDSVGYSGWFAWIRDLMELSVRPKMWGKMSNRIEPDWELVRGQTRLSNGGLYSWSDVKEDPWALLPYVTEKVITEKFQFDQFRVVSESSMLLFEAKGNGVRSRAVEKFNNKDYTLNNLLNFSREAVAHIGYKDRDLLFVRWDVADFVIDKLNGSGGPNVLGYLEKDGKMVVVVDTQLNRDDLQYEPMCELDILNINGISVYGAGEYIQGDSVTFSISTKGEPVRITDWSGNALPSTGGVPEMWDASKVGPQILRAYVGSGNEQKLRPYVVRILPQLEVSLHPVTTLRMAGDSISLRINIDARKTADLLIDWNLPEGWKINETDVGSVKVTAGQTISRIVTFSCLSEVPGGPYTISTNVRSPSSVAKSEITLQRVKSPVLRHDTFMDGAGVWNAPRNDRSGWIVETASGGPKGSMLVVRDRGGARWGRVNVFGDYRRDGSRDDTLSGYSTADFPYLDFYMRTEHEHNLGMSVTLKDGKRYVIMLAGPFQEQWGQSVELPRAKFVPNGEWQRVVYNLDRALSEAGVESPRIVVDIGFGDTRTFSSNQTFDTDEATHYVADFKITRDANENENTIQNDSDAEIKGGSDSKSERPSDRARAAASLRESASALEIASVRELLKDNNRLIRLNAVIAFTRVRDLSVVPDLIEILNIDIDPTISRYVIRALAHQNTPEAWTAIRRFTRASRYDDRPLGEAGLVMGGTGDPTYIRDINVLFASRSWLTRRDAVKAIGQITAPEAQRALTVFLQEVDPMVRIEVGRYANPDVEPVGSRMEWGSVNDLSNVVRAYNYAALTRSSDPVMRARGYAGLKEEDPTIRRIVVEEMARDPQLHHVEHLMMMLSDKNPWVRSSAVQSLLVMPGTRTFSDFNVLAGEDYEVVLLPLLDAGLSGKIIIPRAVLERLNEHRSPDVRKKVLEISNK